MYEAFISFKNLDSKGAQTKDSMTASLLYNMLSSAGIPTFFSNAEIQRRADPHWADVIDKALREAKVIIVVGSRLDYVESEWVKYEWRYFSTQMNSGADKHMITVMNGFRLSDLPPAFAQIQNYSPQNLEGAVDMVCGILGKRRPMNARQPAMRQGAQQGARQVRSPAAAAPKKNKRTHIIIMAGVLAALIIAGIITPEFYSALSKKTRTSELSTHTSAGDYVYFGSWPQTSGGKVKPIEWRVLKVYNGKALLLSEYLLDVYSFDSDNSFWETSDLREQLNNDFLNTAFSVYEKPNLLDINGDKVSMLTVSEAEMYFPVSADRVAVPTAYALSRRTKESGDSEAGRWWLRSSRNGKGYPAYVDSSGSIIDYGWESDYTDVFLRPVILVSL